MSNSPIEANSKIEDYPEVFVQITSCILSAAQYEQNSNLIFDALAQQSKVYTNSFLFTLTKVLLSSEYSPTSKFYALRLLTKATEQKNEFLAKRLARERPLLEKLFRDCQIDGNKPVEDKGRKFFSKTPTDEESIIGNHFIRLILEALVFWRQNYGSEDHKSPLHAYIVMHTTLASRIKFPEEFIFFSRCNDISSGFHPQRLEASLKLEENKQDATHKKIHNTIHIVQIGNNTEASVHVALCISCRKSYKLNSHLVFEALAQNSKAYTEDFLKELIEIFTSAEYPPASKFYALYLLSKATEQKNKFLLKCIARNRPLLDRLFKDSQFDSAKSVEEKGQKFFSKTPTAKDSIIGNHFIRLILEALVFWRHNYGSEDKKGSLYAYTIMHTTLAARIKFPEEFIFFTKSDDVLDKRNL